MEISWSMSRLGASNEANEGSDETKGGNSSHNK